MTIYDSFGNSSAFLLNNGHLKAHIEDEYERPLPRLVLLPNSLSTR